MGDFTPHQRKIIERYYDRRDEIMLGRLQEIVTELYLAESQVRIDRLWERARKAMGSLKVPAGIVEHLLTKRDPETLARNLRGWLETPEKLQRRDTHSGRGPRPA